MRSHPMLGLLLLVGACGGGTYAATLTASPSAGPADAIACAKAQLRPLGYQQTAFDELDNRLNARKVDNSVQRADPRYRRNVDRLEIQAAAGADGTSVLTVTGRTFAEFETHRGPTEEEQRASANVKQSAQAILDACGQP
jgi:hypothetical protein